MAHLDEIDVRLRAIQVVIDLLMWHGLDSFISEANDNEMEEPSPFSQDTASQVTFHIKFFSCSEYQHQSVTLRIILNYYSIFGSHILFIYWKRLI